MSKVESKSVKTLNGLKLLQSLLADIAKRPQHYLSDMELRTALKSQSALAKIDREITTPEGEIAKTFPMSLNTLKTYADSELSGKYKAFDDLRKRASAAIEASQNRQEKPNKRTKTGLSKKIAILEHDLEMHRQTNEILTCALSAAINQFSSIRDAKDERLREKRTRDAIELLVAITSLNAPPFNVPPPDLEPKAVSSEVTNISTYRKN